MPVWHDLTKEWVEQGKLVVVGVDQEQHAARCRLFLQWHEIGWPVAHDPLDVSGVTAVPLRYAIDERGIVRAINPSAETFEQDFLNKDFSGDAATEPADVGVSSDGAKGPAAELIAQADRLILGGDPARCGDAIDTYKEALRIERSGATLFRLGVAYRMRFDLVGDHPTDAGDAFEAWYEALAAGPRNAIWTRRLQQYGPAQGKPYPFYDWIAKARQAIIARGQQPVALAVAPTGAELAVPSKRFATSSQAVSEPDPKRAIPLDGHGLIAIESASAPPRVAPGASARVHVTFQPSPFLRAHWNNEATPLQLWVEAPPGWKLSSRLLTAPQGAGEVSAETRSLDFEVQAPRDADAGPARFSAYALYNVCEDVAGVCMFLRADVPISIEVEDARAR